MWNAQHPRNAGGPVRRPQGPWNLEDPVYFVVLGRVAGTSCGLRGASVFPGTQVSERQKATGTE